MEQDAFREIMNYDFEYDISNIFNPVRFGKLKSKKNNDEKEDIKIDNSFYDNNEDENKSVYTLNELVNKIDKSVLSQMVFDFIKKRNNSDSNSEVEILKNYGINIDSIEKISGLYMTIDQYLEQLINTKYDNMNAKEFHKKFLILKCDFDDEYLKKKIPMKYENQTFESWINQYADKRLRLFKICLDDYEEEELLKFFIIFYLFEDKAMSSDNSFLLDNFFNLIESDINKKEILIKMFLKTDKINYKCFDMKVFFQNKDCLIFIYENFYKKKWI